MHVLEIKDSDFENTIKSNKYVLVDFFATWCGPCKMQAPVLEKLQEEFKDKITICKIDVDNNQDNAKKFNVVSIPTLVLFKDGEAINTMTGFQSEGALKKLISSL